MYEEAGRYTVLPNAKNGTFAVHDKHKKINVVNHIVKLERAYKFCAKMKYEYFNNLDKNMK